MEAARTADIAFVGVGAPRQDSILIREGSIVRWQELEALKGEGAVGDINLRYFDGRGHALSSALDERVIGVSLDEFRGIPHVVGIAGRRRKAGGDTRSPGGKARERPYHRSHDRAAALRRAA